MPPKRPVIHIASPPAYTGCSDAISASKLKLAFLTRCSNPPSSMFHRNPQEQLWHIAEYLIWFKHAFCHLVCFYVWIFCKFVTATLLTEEMRLFKKSLCVVLDDKVALFFEVSGSTPYLRSPPPPLIFTYPSCFQIVLQLVLLTPPGNMEGIQMCFFISMNCIIFAHFPWIQL